MYSFILAEEAPPIILLRLEEAPGDGIGMCGEFRTKPRTGENTFSLEKLSSPTWAGAEARRISTADAALKRRSSTVMHAVVKCSL
jgi:hypothetical protein